MQYASLIIMVVIFGGMIFFMNRSQKKKQKKEEEQRNAVQVGDEIDSHIFSGRNLDFQTTLTRFAFS